MYEPVVKPMTSGLPSGLRVRDWKIAPPTARAAPNTTAATMRGARHSRTTVRTPFPAVPDRTPARSPRLSG
ncbi:putative protein OS=Streptomyces microflavus OX=1919 GN=Smic_04540 PE=4 SV=1 [Streptomyces microflavus]|uniref:Uncharacterized protein n=1 Tax=Streptomyces microflavus TaxID=1919 RepID=A0A7J0CHW8_STRMI|nr:hypothetical protein Smic_04540 [Streptomyces microflavus]